MNILISLRISYCLKPGTDHSVHSLLMPKLIDAAEVKGGKKPTPPADSGQRFSITSVFWVVINLSNYKSLIYPGSA